LTQDAVSEARIAWVAKSRISFPYSGLESALRKDDFQNDWTPSTVSPIHTTRLTSAFVLFSFRTFIYSIDGFGVLAAAAVNSLFFRDLL